MELSIKKTVSKGRGIACLSADRLRPMKIGLAMTTIEKKRPAVETAGRNLNQP